MLRWECQVLGAVMHMGDDSWRNEWLDWLEGSELATKVLKRVLSCREALFCGLRGFVRCTFEEAFFSSNKSIICILISL